MENKPAPSGALAGIAAFVIFGAVILAAVGLYAYRNAGNYFAAGNSNQQPPRSAMTPFTPPPDTAQQRVTPLPPISNSDTGINANLPVMRNANSMSNYSTNANFGTMRNGESMSNMSNSSESRFDYRVKVAQAELRSEPSDYDGESLEILYRGEGLEHYYRKSESSKWYKVKAESGTIGWIDGNFIEEIE